MIKIRQLIIRRLPMFMWLKFQVCELLESEIGYTWMINVRYFKKWQHLWKYIPGIRIKF